MNRHSSVVKKMTEGDKCECGAELPWHLFEVGIDGHVCSCERHYLLKNGIVEQSGTAPNPFLSRRGSS